LEKMKDRYYALREWDQVSGIPAAEKLRALKLDRMAADLWGAGIEGS
jgi:aldehyde:ferredoxin oxidoreductase